MSNPTHPASALFIADLHLCETRPDLSRDFRAFLRGPARAAARLYILGDLFEYWAGDDDDRPFNRDLIDALASLAQAGVQLFFVPGNRDFLIGEAFARQARLQLLEDESVVELDGLRLLLAHGDAWCVDDLAYQGFRQMVRNPAWQKGFLARPLIERRKIIEGLRMQSESAKQDKAAEIMDVNPDAVAASLRAHDYPLIIHGHTHRPDHHRLTVDGRSCERWVLADWRGEGAPYLALENGQLQARRFQPSL